MTFLFTDGYHGHEAPVGTDAAINCRPPADLICSKLDLHITDDDDVMSCSDDLQTDSSQNVNDSDEHRTSGLSIFTRTCHSLVIQVKQTVSCVCLCLWVCVRPIRPSTRYLATGHSAGRVQKSRSWGRKYC